ncbi:hypothetical protein BaRGS_00022667, partial [Batillaria attramentaria]
METFRKLQKEHQSGWNDGMKQCTQESVTVVAIPHPTVMRVQYEDARNLECSTCRPDPRELTHLELFRMMGTFRKGDSVKIIDSYNAAVELQALGKMGTIVDIDGDGDLRVDVNGYRWLVSPVSCTVHYDPNSKDRKPTAVDIAPEQSKAMSIRVNMPNMLSKVSSDSVRDYLQAADQGDIDKVKAFVASNKDRINVRMEGHTALHIACHKGHMDIVSHLLASGADKNAQDDDGDTPLHYAVDG